MGFFNEKKGEDVEHGSELKPDDSTNIQGQTDAVFGEVVEGGPNYRNVCLHTITFLLPNAYEMAGQLDRFLRPDDEDSDWSWCAIHPSGLRHPRSHPRNHLPARHRSDHPLVRLHGRCLQGQAP